MSNASNNRSNSKDVSNGINCNGILDLRSLQATMRKSCKALCSFIYVGNLGV